METKERYEDYGLNLVIWFDATMFWRKASYEEIQSFTQMSVGNVIYDKTRKLFIIISNYCQESEEMDGVAIPKGWLVEMIPLKKEAKSANRTSKKASGRKRKFSILPASNRNLS